MKILHLTFMLAGLSGLAFAVSDSGFVPQNEVPIVPYAQAPLPQDRVTAGVIEAMDHIKSLVQVRDDMGRHWAFYVNTNTPIYNPGRAQIAFQKLAPGDIVAVQYAENDRSVREIQKYNQKVLP